MSRDEQQMRVAKKLAYERRVELDGRTFTGPAEQVAADMRRLASAKRSSADQLDVLASFLLDEAMKGTR